MPRSVFLWCCAAATFALVGCADPPPKAAATIPVKGTVSLDGAPLAEGEIAFSMPGEPPRVLPIKDGAYSGEAYLGKNRVEISAFKDGPPNPNALSTDPPVAKINTIAPQFNFESTLTAEVAKGGANEFKFDVQGQ